LEADDFVVSSPLTVRLFRFWSLQTSLADYSGSIAWSVNNNSSGVPGTVVASGSASPLGFATGQSAFGFNEFYYDVPVNVPLSAGTYWLVLHDGPTSSTPGTDFFWEWSNNTGNSQSKDISLPGQPWVPNFSELAFQADTLPEPGSLLLVGAGLLAAWPIRRRLTK
jgi:hypothetical protein